MKHTLILKLLLVLLSVSVSLNSQTPVASSAQPGYENRIMEYVDSLRVFDTHEHFFHPDFLKQSPFLDFALFFLENGFNDLVSSGLPDTLYSNIYNGTLSPEAKWKIIEPYWQNTLNTASNRTMLLAFNDLYGIKELNLSTVGPLSRKIKDSYQKEWMDHVAKDICKIDYIIQDGDEIKTKGNYIKFITRFDTWITLDSKRVIDSMAIMQLEPIYTLEGLVKALNTDFKAKLDEGMVAIKINLAYIRPLIFEDVNIEIARKVFKTIVNGNKDMVLKAEEARPLQDYMVHQLLKLAEKNKIPVAFHTGLQAGNSNNINNSDPTLLNNLFRQYPDVNFVLFHGGYPFGGELSSLAKNFKNVSIDMNWTYSISPAYAERYLEEWLETVPASKIMAFGGDQRFIENTYGNLVIAKKTISNVLIKKVGENYLSENEAKKIAKMLLYDNGKRFYNIH